MSENYEPKPWLCKECGFVLGVVLRDSSRRQELKVFRNGVHITNIQALGDLSKVVYAATIREGDLTCGMCGAVRSWHRSEQAIEDLLVRRQKRTYGLEPA